MCVVKGHKLAKGDNYHYGERVCFIVMAHCPLVQWCWGSSSSGVDLVAFTACAWLMSCGENTRKQIEIVWKGEDELLTLQYIRTWPNNKYTWNLTNLHLFDTAIRHSHKGTNGGQNWKQMVGNYKRHRQKNDEILWRRSDAHPTHGSNHV
jgi:hypothetical protein